jgi:hypothetical protein
MTHRSGESERDQPARWEYAELRLYRRVTQIHFSHDQPPSIIEQWSTRIPAESLDSRRSTARYLQLNRQEDPIDVLGFLGDDGWELVNSTSVQVTLRYTLKRRRRDGGPARFHHVGAAAE